MNNTTATIDINTNFTLIRAALQQAIDDMDILAYAQGKVGMYQIPAYVINHVEAEPDQIGLIDKTEKDLYDALDAVDDLAPVVLEKLINQRTEEQRDHQPAPQIFEAECYLFPQKSEHFDVNALELVRRGSQLGLAYEADEPLVHVFFRTEGETDDNSSWQDHQIPAPVQSALKLDQDYGHFAPNWIPLWIVREIVRNGYCDLKPNGLVTIRLRHYPGQDLKETLASIGEEA
jgi:hypothetical protein